MLHIGPKVASVLAVDSRASLCFHGHPKRKLITTATALICDWYAHFSKITKGYGVFIGSFKV